MKRFLLSLVVCLGLTGSACAEPQAVLPAETVELFIRAASQVSRYPLTAARPIVIVKPYAWFVENACDGNKDCAVVGVFDPRYPLVVYLNAATPTDIRANTLVHELVHFLQFQNGKLPIESTCDQRALIEAEAYVAAYRFDLETTGTSAEPLDTTLSNCAKDEK